MEKKRRNIFIVSLLVLASSHLGGCYYYAGPPPVVVAPAPTTSSYDVVWDSAFRAAEEAGIQVTSVDQGSGTILGQRGPTSIKITVTRQYDGKIRVELSMQGNQQQTGQIADDFYAAYDRYMVRR